jgi:hypothetical protein
MNKGLTILAKKGTLERMVVFINPNENNILKIINEKYGESWVKVNELCHSDILKFQANEVYLGCDFREDDNYCRGALEIKALK